MGPDLLHKEEKKTDSAFNLNYPNNRRIKYVSSSSTAIVYAQGTPLRFKVIQTLLYFTKIFYNFKAKLKQF